MRNAVSKIIRHAALQCRLGNWASLNAKVGEPREKSLQSPSGRQRLPGIWSGLSVSWNDEQPEIHGKSAVLHCLLYMKRKQLDPKCSLSENSEWRLGERKYFRLQPHYSTVSMTLGRGRHCRADRDGLVDDGKCGWRKVWMAESGATLQKRCEIG